jgi:hypothetical protein
MKKIKTRELWKKRRRRRRRRIRNLIFFTPDPDWDPLQSKRDRRISN